jgi:Heterokaryon incompatibility protein (HET)
MDHTADLVLPLSIEQGSSSSPTEKLSATPTELVKGQRHNETIIPLEVLNHEASKKIYKPLGDEEIRIVVLCKGTTDAQIECSLEVVSKHSLPEYEALSYAWGPQAKPTSVLLNQVPYLITQNLFEALQQLRYPEKDRMVWIDALAINQSDNSERGHQVKGMSQIYAKAEQVLVWLGIGDMDTRYAMDLLKEDPTTYATRFPPIMSYAEMIDNKDKTNVMLAMLHFSQINYWKRLWVTQEVASARKAVILLGSKAVDYDVAILALDQLTATVLPGDYSSDVQQYTFKYVVNNEGPHNLLAPGSMDKQIFISVKDWLGKYMHQYCSDPRDLIFGLYGCFEPDFRIKIDLDYAKSAVEVFHSFTKAIIEYSGNLVPLAHKAKTTDSCQNSPVGWPSWVLNYPKTKTRVIFSDGLHWHNICPPNCHYFSNSEVDLAVRGVCLGSVEMISNTYLVSFHDNEERRQGMLGQAKHDYHYLKMNRGKKNALRAFPITREELEQLIAVSEAKGDMRLSRDAKNELDFVYLLHLGRPMFSFLKADQQDVSKDPSGVVVGFGLGVDGMRCGDKVYMICGLSGPAVMRAVSGANRFELVGDCWVSGYMVSNKDHQYEMDKVKEVELEQLVIC